MNQYDTRLRRDIQAKSPNQEYYLDILSKHDMVFCVGPAGSGKTACAIGYGVKQFYDRRFDRIVVTRPAVGVDEFNAKKSLGFLPGEIEAKMGPFIKPILEELNKYFHWDYVKKLIADETIEIAPLYYIRGRNFHHTFVICDEGQNASYNELLALTTRMGGTGQLVVTGDLDQHDSPDDISGLEIYLDEIVDYIDDIAIVELEECDIVRHALVRKIVHYNKLYQERKKKDAKRHTCLQQNKNQNLGYGRLFSE